MKRSEKRNELVIHGIFILVVMVLCLVSTVTFALAAEGDQQNHPPTPEEIQNYLAENPDNLPPDVLAQMQQMVNDPQALEALANELTLGLPDAGTDSVSGGIRNTPNPDALSGSISNFPSDTFSNTPFVEGAAFMEGAAFAPSPEELANMTPEELSDFQLMQDAAASGNREVMESLMEKYGHEEGENSGHDFFVGNEQYNDMSEHAGGNDWEAMYQEWEASGGPEGEYHSEFEQPSYDFEHQEFEPSEMESMLEDHPEFEPYDYEPPENPESYTEQMPENYSEPPPPEMPQP